MLMNLDVLRTTHARFVNWTFAEDNVMKWKLHYGIFGPMDQGAYSAFYQGRFYVRSSAAWNWKPYWGGATLRQSGEVTGSMQVVHFHGPKPQDYRRVKLCGGLRG